MGHLAFDADADFWYDRNRLKITKNLLKTPQKCQHVAQKRPTCQPFLPHHQWKLFCYNVLHPKPSLPQLLHKITTLLYCTVLSTVVLSFLSCPVLRQDSCPVPSFPVPVLVQALAPAPGEAHDEVLPADRPQRRLQQDPRQQGLAPCTMPPSTVYCTVLHCTALYCTQYCSTVLSCPVLSSPLLSCPRLSFPVSVLVQALAPAPGDAVRLQQDGPQQGVRQDLIQGLAPRVVVPCTSVFLLSG